MTAVHFAGLGGEVAIAEMFYKKAPEAFFIVSKVRCRGRTRADVSANERLSRVRAASSRSAQDGLNVLHHACTRGRLEMVQWLAEHRLSVQAPDDVSVPVTPLCECDIGVRDCVMF